MVAIRARINYLNERGESRTLVSGSPGQSGSVVGLAELVREDLVARIPTLTATGSFVSLAALRRIYLWPSESKYAIHCPSILQPHSQREAFRACSQQCLS